MTANRSETGFSEWIACGMYCWKQITPLFMILMITSLNETVQYKCNTPEKVKRHFTNNTCEKMTKRIICGKPISMHLATCKPNFMKWGQVLKWAWDQKVTISTIAWQSQSDSNIRISFWIPKKKHSNKFLRLKTVNCYPGKTKLIKPKSSKHNQGNCCQWS